MINIKHYLPLYINCFSFFGYIKPFTRNRKSPIDDFKQIIKSLLSEESLQVFYYKRVLYQYLKDNHGLNCVQSSFRRYIYNNPEFNDYFKRRRKGYICNNSTMRYETDKGHQAEYRLSLKKTQDILFSFLNKSFETFGGVPKELLTDNIKTIVDEPRTPYRKGIIICIKKY